MRAFSTLPLAPARPQLPNDGDLSGYHSFNVQWRRPILGQVERFDVVANGWLVVDTLDDPVAASLVAARLNYQRRYNPDFPGQLGLDGLAE